MQHPEDLLLYPHTNTGGQVTKSSPVVAEQREKTTCQSRDSRKVWWAKSAWLILRRSDFSCLTRMRWKTLKTLPNQNPSCGTLVHPGQSFSNLKLSFSFKANAASWSGTKHLSHNGHAVEPAAAGKDLWPGAGIPTLARGDRWTRICHTPFKTTHTETAKRQLLITFHSQFFPIPCLLNHRVIMRQGCRL